MPRLPRSTFPAYGVFHLTTRGVERRAVFLDRDDRRSFLTQLWRTVDRYDWIVYVVCLMTNHYHFVLRTTAADIAAGMHRLNSRWAGRYNRRYLFTGHVFERRYASRLVTSDEQLLGAIRYVVLNPVRAGLCDHPSEWEWSSYNATRGAAWASDFLSVASVLRLFHASPTIARRRFQTFVEAPLELPV